MNEPPNKKIKSSIDFVDTIRECYDLKFRNAARTADQDDCLTSGVQKLRETLEQISSSRDVAFGSTKTSAKINWGKCLGLMLEDGPKSLTAVKILTERLNPGGGLL